MKMITILLKNKHIVLKINYLCYIMCFDYFLYVV